MNLLTEVRQCIEDGTALKSTQEMDSLGLPIRVYVHRGKFECPDIRKCYSDRIA